MNLEEETYPVRGIERATIPYCREEVKSELAGMICMLATGECCRGT